MNYDDMFDEVEPGAGTEKSELMLVLPDELQTDIRAFLAWLKVGTSFKTSTISSYKTYVCKYFGIKLGLCSDEMTRDYKSGAKKFRFWLENVKAD